MSDLYWLTDEQMARLQPYFPNSHGKPRVDDRRVLSGIVFVNRNGLRWRDAPKDYGPHKTLYNRWKRWGWVRARIARIAMSSSMRWRSGVTDCSVGRVAMMKFLSLKKLHRLPPLPQDQTSARLRYLTAATTAAQRLRALGPHTGRESRD